MGLLVYGQMAISQGFWNIFFGYIYLQGQCVFKFLAQCFTVKCFIYKEKPMGAILFIAQWLLPKDSEQSLGLYLQQCFFNF